MSDVFAALGLVVCDCGKVSAPDRETAVTAAALFAASHGQDPVRVRVYSTALGPLCTRGASRYHWTRKSGSRSIQPATLLRAVTS